MNMTSRGWHIVRREISFHTNDSNGEARRHMRAVAAINTLYQQHLYSPKISMHIYKPKKLNEWKLCGLRDHFQLTEYSYLCSCSCLLILLNRYYKRKSSKLWDLLKCINIQISAIPFNFRKFSLYNPVEVFSNIKSLYLLCRLSPVEGCCSLTKYI